MCSTRRIVVHMNGSGIAPMLALALGTILSARHHVDELAYPFDFDLHAVAGLEIQWRVAYKPYPFWSTSEDDSAREKRRVGGTVAHDGGDIEYHVRSPRFLHDLSVQSRLQRQIAHVYSPCGCDRRPQW
eukprot:CAMPEP_0170185034 /NCGR_PEP_ID=MMETSP0040_2-20121228/35399_1 /TAXON_ID=641309 /ORGANISM="Lotharella oceanica, Strain CCMP622" /LENGTH=128 /DNA_ID=CAMNT_0010431297 /DNA_START=96 /DNA_END=483 /DNA_ORIENTATION=+